MKSRKRINEYEKLNKGFVIKESQRRSRLKSWAKCWGWGTGAAAKSFFFSSCYCFPSFCCSSVFFYNWSYGNCYLQNLQLFFIAFAFCLVCVCLSFVLACKKKKTCVVLVEKLLLFLYEKQKTDCSPQALACKLRLNKYVSVWPVYILLNLKPHMK